MQDSSWATQDFLEDINFEDDNEEFDELNELEEDNNDLKKKKLGRPKKYSAKKLTAAIKNEAAKDSIPTQILVERFNKPELIDRNKRHVNVLGELFLRKYHIMADMWDKEQAYQYKPEWGYWKQVSTDYLRGLAMNIDTLEYTTSARRKQTVQYAIDSNRRENIPWNKVENFEIPIKDGILNINTGEVREHAMENFLERTLPHNYDKYAMCPTWRRCLNEWFGRDDQCKIFLQEFFGYILLPHAKYKRCCFLQGESDSGKSVVVDVARKMVGHENVCSIGVHQMDDPRKIAPIKGKMLNLLGELSKDTRIDDGGFKLLISTEEPVQLDQKFEHAECYIPKCKHLVATNNLPKIDDQSEAVYNRITILHFPFVVSKEKMDRELSSKLEAELPGIIRWAVEGAKRLTKNKGMWTKVKSSDELIQQYKKDQNPVLNFIEDSGIVKKDPGSCIPVSIFVDVFNQWKGGKRWSKVAIGKGLKKLGIESIPTGRHRVYKGLELAGAKKNKNTRMH